MRTAAQLQVDYPHGQRRITAAAGRQEVLTELLRRADLPLNTRCGQRGLCRGCEVELLSGQLLRVDKGGANEIRVARSRLRACQYALPANGDARIRVPFRSLLAQQPQIATSFRINVTRAHRPLWQRFSVPLPLARQSADQQADLVRRLALGPDEELPLRGDPSLQPAGDDSQGEADIEFAIEFCGDHWMLLRRGLRDQNRQACGVAVDLGTTTVAAMLIDLQSGETLATASALNAQTHLGDNVLTRISLCLNDPSQVATLQRLVVQQTLAPMMAELLTSSGLGDGEIAAVTVAGNATMLHLLAGVNPGSMGTAPFTPVFLDHRVIRLPELSACIQTSIPSLAKKADDKQPLSPFRPTCAGSSGPTIHLLPAAAAYVGADIAAGVFSSGMRYRDETILLVDVGTNGEIVLKYGEQLVGCATAAGPAFEGGRLSCGVRAGQGAIGHVRLVQESGRIQADLEIIGGGPASGLCGTAYVDFLAQARRLGLIGPTGRICESADGSGWLHPLEHGRGFLIAVGRDEQPIFVSESDIASLLQAKAAIAAGIICLLQRFELQSADVDTLYLAGGFGFHMDVSNLIDCGLLPGFRPSQVQVVGNTSLAGAYLALLDVGVLQEINEICQQMDISELNLEPSFESHYIDQLYLGDAQDGLESGPA